MEEEKNPVKIDHGVNYPARNPRISRGESIRELQLTRVGVYGFRLAPCVVDGAHKSDAVRKGETASEAVQTIRHEIDAGVARKLLACL